MLLLVKLMASLLHPLIHQAGTFIIQKGLHILLQILKPGLLRNGGTQFAGLGHHGRVIS